MMNPNIYISKKSNVHKSYVNILYLFYMENFLTGAQKYYIQQVLSDYETLILWVFKRCPYEVSLIKQGILLIISNYSCKSQTLWPAI